MSRSKHLYTVGTRGSKLALIQTQEVIDLLRQYDSDAEFRIQIISTRGDIDQQGSLPRMGAVGVFTSEIEQHLLNHQIDLAVHSAKDLPVQIPNGLSVVAYTPRFDARDALVTASRLPLAELPSGTIVATSSPRRQALVRRLRPDLNFTCLRGNIDTRIRKVRHGGCQATILAHAGLLRAGMADEADEVFDVEQFPPAAGQGALAVQCRHDDMRVFELLERVNHQPTARAVMAERNVLQILQAGCGLPLAVCATYPPDKQSGNSPHEVMDLHAVLLDPANSQWSVDARAVGPAHQGHQLARQVCQQLLDRGGQRVIDSVARST